jgi:flagellar biosynthesis/type III secretory pathway protein FliH
MDPLEHLGSTHECFSDLLHAIEPRILIRIACAAAGIVPLKIVKIRYRNPRIETPRLAKRPGGNAVDLVFTVHAANGRTVEVWVLEIQCTYDTGKRRRWALYLAAFAEEHDADARLVVFSPEPRLRRRIRNKLLPRVDPPPILLEPDQIERITDYDDARRRPELTILGCLYHTHEPARPKDRVAAFRAAWIAIQSLAGRPSQRYSILVMSIVPPAVRQQGIEELREAGELDESRFEQFMEIERKGSTFHRGHEEGHEEGRKQGRKEGRKQGRKEGRKEGRKQGHKEGHCRMLRRAVLDVLDLRGFALTAALRERLESCDSIELLERWYTTAKSAAANHPLDELLS